MPRVSPILGGTWIWIFRFRHRSSGQGSFKLHLILFKSGEGSPSNFTPQPYPLIPILHRHHGAAITSYSIHRDPGREVVRLRGAEGSSVAAANTCFLVHCQAVVVPQDDAVNCFWNVYVYGVIAFMVLITGLI